MPLSRRTLLAAAALLSATAPAVAQGRRTLASDNPEAQLMGYFAAVMQFAPVGLMPAGSRREIGGELTFIPSLSEADRTVGFGGTKLERTNFCPVLPRLRVGASFGRNSVEAGLTPPLRVCGVKATLLSAAFTRRFDLSDTWGAALRVTALAGSLAAAITCSADAVADQADLTCRGGQPSDDRVKPLAFGFDAAISYAGWQRHNLEPYLLAGLRRERVALDVNYTRVGTAADPAFDDHERFQATLTRWHAALGASWNYSDRIRLGGEIFYAPGALLTVRGRASLALGGRS